MAVNPELVQRLREGGIAAIPDRRLHDADFTEAKLQLVDFSGGDLARAIFTKAKLTGAVFRATRLRKANFVEAQLRGADLSAAYLRRAIFDKATMPEADLHDVRASKASFDGAELQNANLRGADLRESSLRGADLRNAELADANLQDADLTGTVGLIAGQLAGTNVTNAKLPAHIAAFQSLTIIEETSKRSATLFTAMLAATAFVLLTLGATSDVALLTNNVATKLPLLGVDLSMAWFGIAAPLVLLAIYLYFHFNLQVLWEEISLLPAIFPDGRPLHRHTYPWLVNDFVLAQIPRLSAYRTLLQRFQHLVLVVLVWWFVPLSMLLIWIRFMRKQHAPTTIFHFLVTLAAMAIASRFVGIAIRTLRRGRPLSNAQIMWRRVGTTARVVLALLMVLVSWCVIRGVDEVALKLARRSISREVYVLLPYAGEAYDDLFVTRRHPRIVVPRLLKRLGLAAFPVFDLDKLSRAPERWDRTRDPVNVVDGANLRNRSLRYASGRKAFLVAADLSRVVLHGAMLNDADLRGANLTAADLQLASLAGANFEGAFVETAVGQRHPVNFTGTTLSNANFSKSLLPSALFAYAYILRTNFSGADLDGAIFDGAYISDADFTRADLRRADLSGVKVMMTANIQYVCYDSSTKWPGGFDPDSGGAVRVNDNDFRPCTAILASR